ncbi:MAG TPA: hypothetical protein VD993_07370 [Chitinophagaceae bacterium]|nr:hypothetical protein [Chitinophagaceae bacterium]
MRTLFVLLLATITCCTFAQEREFPDFRSKKENFLRMQEKDIRADLASFTMGGMDESMGKGKLASIPATSYGNDYITFSGDNIQVTIKAVPFDESKHKLQFYNKEHLVRINGKPYYGNYGEIPSTVISSVTVLIGKDTVAIPAAAYADLYEPDFTYLDGSGVVKSYNKVYLSPDKSKIYIYMLNRDNTGSYEVTWVIKDKQYLRRVIDFGFLKQ